MTRAYRAARWAISLTLLATVLAVAPANAEAASFVVTTCGDSGTGSLRAAIVAANADDGATPVDPHRITFALDPPCDTIALTSGQLTVSNHIEIVGPGAGALKVASASNTARVLAVPTGATVSISGLTLTNGRVINGEYGGAVVSSGTLTIHDCVVSSSVAPGSATYGGGGVANLNGIMTVTNSVITGNNSVSGGGIFNASGTLTVLNSVISDNTARLGAGIINQSGTLTVIGSTFTGNRVAGFGGAIYNQNGTLTVVNSTLSHNNAVRGGGVYNGNGTATVLGSTIVGNMASAIAGGLFSDGGGNTLTAVGATIIAQNTSPASPDASGAFTDNGFNLIGDVTGSSGLTNGANGTLAGDVGSPLDPLLEPLSDNGGPTPTHALGSGSAALDRIPFASCPSLFDQRGYARPVNALCDIGAFEHGALPPLPPSAVSIVINHGAAWTNDAAVTVDLSASDDYGIVSYALAPTQDALDTADEISVDPAEPTFGRADLPYTFPAGDGAARIVWLRVCDMHEQCLDVSASIGLDTGPPVVTAPESLLVVASSNTGAVVDLAEVVTAEDALSGVADGWPQCAPPSGSLFALGQTSVTCTAQDMVGNSGSAAFTVAVVRDRVQGCLYAGGLGQLTVLPYGEASTVACSRGTVMVLEQGAGYHACLFSGSLSQVGTTQPGNCGRGVAVSFAAGDGLHGCLFAGSMSQVGPSQPTNCGRGVPVSLALVTG